MIRRLSRLTAILLSTPLLATIAVAQSTVPDPRTFLFFDRLQQLSPTSSEPRAVVSRSFAVTVKAGIIVRSSPPPPHDVICEVSLFHSTEAGGSYFETKAQKYVVPKTGRGFICEITLNVRWQRADTTRPVSVTVAIRPMARELAYLPNQQEYERNRSSFESLPPIPLPANGSTTLIQTVGAI